MDIFFAVNDAYARQLSTAIVSIAENNKSSPLDFHILTTDFSAISRRRLEKICLFYKNVSFTYHQPDVARLEKLALNIDYISVETYFRYLIAEIVPGLDKCLYLDADIVVNGSLEPLWNMPLGDNYCVGVEDLFIIRQNYKPKIGFAANDLYVNAGVLLLNLRKIRADGMGQKLIDNTERLAGKILYQDQDIINITFKGHIAAADSIYNFASANVRREPGKRKKAVIIHYTGSAKPWHTRCANKLKDVWRNYAKNEQLLQKRKIKVGLIIDEFFGGAGTAYGGYGFLARKFIAKYIPDDDIQIDVLLGRGSRKLRSEKFHVDDVDLYRLPRWKFFVQRWLKKKNYDIYLSIELVSDFVLKNETNPQKKLILWIQDPRPMYEWDEINTVTLFPEKCYYKQEIYDTVHRWYEQGRVCFISQGEFLNPKAKDLYNLPDNVPIRYVPNPVEIDENFDVEKYSKQNHIIFLGRIESVKRGWLFCEIAKRMPEYEFFVLGQSFRQKEDNARILEPYTGVGIKNLHFAGHVDGEEKADYLRKAKILVNTSIHEALPVSFLEALSYGTLLVSNRNPEELTAKFGIWVGDVLGDGFDKVDLYVEAIRKIMADEKQRMQKAREAVAYVREVHNVPRFVKDLKEAIKQEVRGQSR